MWFWAVFLILSALTFALRAKRRRFAVVPFLLALCTLALAAVIFWACAAYAPLSMGLATPIAATAETTIMCLSKDALGTAILWTIVVALLTAGVALALWGRLPARDARRRALPYIGAALMLLIAGASVPLYLLGFALCSTRWVY
jgi:hypothetical protein